MLEKHKMSFRKQNILSGIKKYINKRLQQSDNYNNISSIRDPWPKIFREF